MIRKLLATLIVLSFAFATPSYCQTKIEFKDVKGNYWAKEAIFSLVEKNIIFGYADNTFKPDKNINRIQAYSMLIRALGYEVKDYGNIKTIDMPKGSDNYNVISTAKEFGFYFEPSSNVNHNEEINRGEMAIILSRAFNISREWEEGDFKDVISKGLNAAVETLASYNITLGYPDKTFRPYDKVTRAQFSAFLFRTLNIPDNIKNRIYKFEEYDTPIKYNGLEIQIGKVTTREDTLYKHYAFSYKITNISDTPMSYGSFRGLFENRNYSLPMMGGSSVKLMPGKTVENTAKFIISHDIAQKAGEPVLIEFAIDYFDRFIYKEPSTTSLKWKFELK